MTASLFRDWVTCVEAGCIGSRLADSELCLAHNSDQVPSAFEAELERISEHGSIDARGVRLSAELLSRLLNAAPRDSDGRIALQKARFDRATFEHGAALAEVTFQGEARFDEATFEGEVTFAKSTFQGLAYFVNATFKWDALFVGAAFEREAFFVETTFEGKANFFRASLSFLTAFIGTTFKGRANFEEATFAGSRFGFSEARFRGEAWFVGATFQGQARFDKATFEGSAWFSKATFKGRAWFAATFERWAQFSATTFEGEAAFAGARFLSEAEFGGATFREAAVFSGASFQEEAGFVRAFFKDEARFDGATFRGLAGFDGAVFEAAREFGPVLARRQLSFKAATFTQRVRIEAAAATLCASQTRFPGGMQLRLRWAQVVLDDADLAAPSIIEGVRPFAGLDEDRFARAWRRLLPAQGRDGRPRLLSVRRADVAGLTVANADLRSCRFLGAHNLDKLRVEGDASLGSTPGPWRWTTRQTIAEEHHWRSSRTAASNPPLSSASHAGWYCAPYRPPDWLEVEEVTPAQIATLYRARRKSREDNKDEPGAADFYYGEMEMRRQARHQQAIQDRRRGDWGTWAAARLEHAILWLYWLVSGYALRAWRALATLAAVLAVFAALCTYGGGFAPQAGADSQRARPSTTTSRSPGTTGAATASTASADVSTISGTADTSFGGALVYGARTAIGLRHDPQPQLTRRGDVLEILLRILAPVLLGLAILSVRGRVKR